MKYLRFTSAGLFVLLFLLTLRLGTHSTAYKRPATISPTSPLQPNELWLPTGTSILSDFDGDDLSDLAVGRAEGNTYRVEIRLTTRPEKTLTALTSNELGIGLFACDIDRDNDQDLVVSSPISLHPLVVWLSDGNGHFEEGNRRLYVDLLVEENTPGFGQNSFQPEQISISQGERSPLDSPCVNFEESRSEENGTAVEAQTPSPSILAYSLAPRSPPSDYAL